VTKAAASPNEIRSGVVRAYDDEVGLGEIESDGVTFPFHATTIADGTRTILPGTRVCFVVVFAPRGRIEAAEVTPL
jgi:cold shock CspA family protein